MTTQSAPVSGRALRRLTRTAMQAHGGGSVTEMIGEAYGIVLTIVITGSLALGAAQVLNAQLRPSTIETTLHPVWLAVILAVASLGAVMSLSGRLGPLGMAGGQAAWWLPTPVDRRGLLRPRLVTGVLVAFGAGAGAGALIGALAGGQGSAVLMAAGVGAGGSLVALLVAAWLQVAGFGRSVPLAVTIGDAMVVCAPVAALGVAVGRPAPPTGIAAATLAVAAAALMVVAVGMLALTDRRLDDISGAVLRARGAVTAHAAGAATSLDTRELGRALTITSERDSRRRSVAFGWVRGPISALVTGDALLTLRSRRQMIALVATVLIPVVVTLAGWASWTAVLAVLVGGYPAALSATEGARRAEIAPVLDRSFPLDAKVVRRVRLIWPAAVTMVWTVVSVGTWALLSGMALWPWLVLAVVAGPVFAAGAIRGAYRKPTDWSAPLISNPMGPPIPPGLVGAISRGPDIVVICLLPLILGIVAVAAPATLLPWQLMATLVAVAIATHVPNPSSPFGTNP
ncbi:MAG: DUF6297 family protein [Beutenbergiaceae bacterium]